LTHIYLNIIIVAMASDFMSLTEAQLYLGVSRIKMSKLAREKGLEIFTDPLDKRKKLLRREDVERLKTPTPQTPVAPQKTALSSGRKAKGNV